MTGLLSGENTLDKYINYALDYTCFENPRKRRFAVETDQNIRQFNPIPSPLLNSYNIDLRWNQRI